MRRLLLISLLVVVIFGGLLLGPALVEYDGYLLVVMENGTLQMSIFGVILSLLIVAAIGWIFIWLIKKIIGVMSGSQQWFGSWSSRKRQKAFTQGLISLAEGDAQAAQKWLQKIENEDFDGINLLAAAEVELQLKNTERAREYWQKAGMYSQSEVAATLCLARDRLSQADPKAALSLIHQLSDSQRKKPSVIKVWAESLAQAGRWQELKTSLAGWKKALGPDLFSHWVQQSSQGEFAEIASKEGAIQLKERWRSLPRATRRDPAQQAAYIQQLILQGMHQDAEDLLIENQKSHPVPALMPLFRQLTLPNPARSIKVLEKWLKHDENNAELYSILGELAYNAKDLVLAEKALNKATTMRSNNGDVRLLAKIKESLHQDQQALSLYKKSIS